MFLDAYRLAQLPDAARLGNVAVATLGKRAVAGQSSTTCWVSMALPKSSIFEDVHHPAIP
ncbi:MAG: hypothetical protein ACI9BW_004513 [Gammaproteobacteria bacterium]|jgi:hypothetical protein